MDESKHGGEECYKYFEWNEMNKMLKNKVLYFVLLQKLYNCDLNRHNSQPLQCKKKKSQWSPKLLL